MKAGGDTLWIFEKKSERLYYSASTLLLCNTLCQYITFSKVCGCKVMKCGKVQKVSEQEMYISELQIFGN